MTEYLTKAEVAGRLRVTERSVNRYIAAGLLEAVKTTDTPNGHIRITVTSYEAFVAERAVTPADAR